MSAPVNPVEVEAQILTINALIESGVDYLKDLDERRDAAVETLRDAFNDAYLAATGTPTEKRIRAEVATRDLRAASRVEVLAMAHAERRMRGLERQLTGYQAVMKSVTGMYGASGSGRGH